MHKILIADAVEESAAALAEALRERCTVRICTDGETASVLLRDFAPDILVVDLLLPKTDGLSLLQDMPREAGRPMVLVQTNLVSPYVMERLGRLKVDYVVCKPCALQALEARIADFLAQLGEGTSAPSAVGQRPADLLIRLGFSVKLDGFTYLSEAIPRFAADPDQSITKELYSRIGALYGKDGTLVERCVRSAIEKAWQNRDEGIWRQYFGYGADRILTRPSNGAFIARMAQIWIAEKEKLAL